MAKQVKDDSGAILIIKSDEELEIENLSVTYKEILRKLDVIIESLKKLATKEENNG